MSNEDRGMTIELTHEQANQLRMISVFMPWYCDDKIVESLRWASSIEPPLVELGWRSDESSIWQLSDAGREALAAYDATNTIISRSTLSNLCEMLLKRDPLLGSDELHPVLAEVRAALEAK